MRRILLIAAAVLLVVSSLPNAAASTAIAAENTTAQTTSEEYVVGSQHTDDSDFGAARTLRNVSVQGSGSTASVTLDRTDLVDGFEDGSLDPAWTYTTSEYIVATESKNGNYALEHNSDTGINFMGRGSVTGDVIVEGWVQTYETGSGTYPGLSIGIQDGSNGIRTTVQGFGNEFTLDLVENGSSTVLDSASLSISKNTWYYERVERSGSTVTATLYDGHPDNGGSALVELNATVDKYRSGKAGVASSREGRFDDINITELGSPENGQYISANLSTSRAEQAAVNISQLSDAESTIRVEYWTGSAWDVGASATVSSAGNHTFSLPDVSAEEWRTNISWTRTGPKPEWELADESILFTPQDPEIDNSSLEPNSTASSIETPLELSADVSDYDFTRDEGEELTVEWFVDGEKRGETATTSNGTVSHTLDSVDAGTHDWHIEVTDQWGHTSRSATAEFVAPSELRIYNESAPSELVANVTVDIEYYYRDDVGDGDLIVTRNTSNGVINMTGLPTTQPFVVVAEANGYVSRRIFVSNLSATQRVYLLPDQGQVTQNEFVIQDLTGYFPQEDTVLQIQRSLQSEWRTVHGDYFGASGSFPATLRYNVRHRLIVTNVETGRTRELGTYTAQDSGEVVVTIRSDPTDDEITVGGTANVRIDPSTRTLLAGNETVTVSIDNGDAEISEWTADLIAQNTNGENTTVESVTVSGSLRRQIDVNLSEYAEGRLYVEVSWSGEGSLSGQSSATYGISPNYNNDASMLGVLSMLPDMIPEDNLGVFQTFVWIIGSVLLTVGFATTTRASTETVALSFVSMIAAGSLINWVPYSLLFSVVVAFAALAAVRRRI